MVEAGISRSCAMISVSPEALFCANIGDNVAVFEPTHGSAPKYEELKPSIVNPIAMFLSACMMLDHIGETEKAEKERKRGQRPFSPGAITT